MWILLYNKPETVCVLLYMCLYGIKYFLWIFIKQNITEVNGRNNMLEIMLEDANRLVTFYQTKEKSLIEGEC